MSDPRPPKYKIVSWDEYCELPEEDAKHVRVVTFTGVQLLTDGATLGEEGSAGGDHVQGTP